MTKKYPRLRNGVLCLLCLLAILAWEFVLMNDHRLFRITLTKNQNVLVVKYLWFYGPEAIRQEAEPLLRDAKINHGKDIFYDILTFGCGVVSLSKIQVYEFREDAALQRGP